MFLLFSTIKIIYLVFQWRRQQREAHDMAEEAQRERFLGHRLRGRGGGGRREYLAGKGCRGRG